MENKLSEMVFNFKRILKFKVSELRVLLFKTSSIPEVLTFLVYKNSLVSFFPTKFCSELDVK